MILMTTSAMSSTSRTIGSPNGSSGFVTALCSVYLIVQRNASPTDAAPSDFLISIPFIWRYLSVSAALVSSIILRRCAWTILRGIGASFDFMSSSASENLPMTLFGMPCIIFCMSGLVPFRTAPTNFDVAFVSAFSRAFSSSPRKSNVSAYLSAAAKIVFLSARPIPVKYSLSTCLKRPICPGAAVSACEASLRIWSSVLASSSSLIWLADLSL